MSYLFNGDDQFYTATLPFTALPATGMTLVAWVKIAAAPAATDTIIQLGHTVNTNNWYALNINASGQVVASNDLNGTADNNALTSATVPNATWSMIAAVFTGDNAGRRAYVDGTLDSNDTSSTATDWTSIATNGRLAIGGTPAFTQDYDGYIAHVQIYDKALSEAELDTLHGGANPTVAATSADLVAYWPLTTDSTASVGGTLSLNNTPVLDDADNPTVSAATIRYLKLLTEASAASAASIEGVVLNDTRDTVIGEFTGQSFEASLESGEAVLLVPVDDVIPNGSTLTTSDTPIVFAYNATESIIGPGSATVVEI